MKKILPILTLTIFLLTFTKVSASLATDYPNVSGKQIIIKTYLTADQAENEVPKLEVYANNGMGFVGIKDNLSCDPSAGSLYRATACGTPNKFDDKNVDDIKVDTSPFISTITTNTDKILENVSVNSTKEYVTKLSYVYHNDVWRSASVDRNVYISKVEFIDATDNQILLTYSANNYTNPSTPTDPAAKSYIYFDMGIVNNSGISDSSQNGMINAFDKVELRTIEEDNSRANGKWSLKTEGSLNINTRELATKLIAKYPNGTSPTPTPNPTPNLEYDLNGDNKFDILDLVALIRRVFQG